MYSQKCTGVGSTSWKLLVSGVGRGKSHPALSANDPVIQDNFTNSCLPHLQRVIGANGGRGENNSIGSIKHLKLGL